MRGTAYAAAALVALALLVTGCHATSGWDRRAPSRHVGGAGGAVPVISVESYGRTHDHLGRRIPQG